LIACFFYTDFYFKDFVELSNVLMVRHWCQQHSNACITGVIDTSEACITGIKETGKVGDYYWPDQQHW
jgi:hypothetical protein